MGQASPAIYLFAYPSTHSRPLVQPRPARGDMAGLRATRLYVPKPYGLLVSGTAPTPYLLLQPTYLVPMYLPTDLGAL